MRRPGSAARAGWWLAAAGTLGLLGALGCDGARRQGSEQPPASADSSNLSDTGARHGESCAPHRPHACFGPLMTIAGTGTIREKGVSGWRPEFEGGPALQAELSRPHFAMSDAQGNIYIADKDAHAIRKVDPDGVITTVAGVNEPGDDGDQPGPGRERHLSRPNGVWAKPDGTLFILDLGNAKVRRLATNGELTTFFHVPGLAIGRGLWVSADESTAYVASASRVLRWTREAGLAEYARGFSQLGNLFLDSDGSLLVTDRNAGRLYAIRSGGQRELLAGGGSEGGDGAAGPAARLPGLRAVWPDGHGGMFLGLHHGSAVWYLDETRTLHRLLGEPEVSEVRGLALAPAGDLLITDHDGGFIRRLPRLRSSPRR